MTVVDASAIVDLLLPSNESHREFLLAELPEPVTPWLAPDILIFEVYAVVRRHALREVLSAPTAARALERLARLPIELIPTAELLTAGWGLRENFGAADSLYAALALRAGEPLLTTDTRLVRAAAAAGAVVRSPG